MPADIGVRALDAVRLAGASDLDRLAVERAVNEAALDPARLRAVLAEHAPGRVFVAGTLERRLLLLESGDTQWVAADLSGRPLWPLWLLVRQVVREGSHRDHPCLRWVRRAANASAGTVRCPPWGFLESRRPMPASSRATSTQAPPLLPLRLLLRHVVVRGFMAGSPSRMIIG